MNAHGSVYVAISMHVSIYTKTQFPASTDSPRIRIVLPAVSVGVARLLA